MGPWRAQLDNSLQTAFFDKLQFSTLQTSLPPYGFTGNAFPWICWNLWTSRNHLLFEHRHSSATEVFGRAIVSLKEWEAAQPLKSTLVPKAVSCNRTLAETSSEIICNTDASWKGGGGESMQRVQPGSSQTPIHEKSSEDQPSKTSSPCLAWLKLQPSAKHSFKRPQTTTVISVSNQTLKCSLIRSTSTDDQRSFSEFSSISTTLSFHLLHRFSHVVFFSFPIPLMNLLMTQPNVIQQLI